MNYQAEEVGIITISVALIKLKLLNSQMEIVSYLGKQEQIYAIQLY